MLTSIRNLLDREDTITVVNPPKRFHIISYRGEHVEVLDTVIGKQARDDAFIRYARAAQRRNETGVRITTELATD